MQFSLKRMMLAVACLAGEFGVITIGSCGETLGILGDVMWIVLVAALPGVAISLLCNRVWPGLYLSIILALLLSIVGGAATFFFEHLPHPP